MLLYCVEALQSAVGRTCTHQPSPRCCWGLRCQHATSQGLQQKIGCRRCDGRASVRSGSTCRNRTGHYRRIVDPVRIGKQVYALNGSKTVLDLNSLGGLSSNIGIQQVVCIVQRQIISRSDLDVAFSPDSTSRTLSSCGWRSRNQTTPHFKNHQVGSLSARTRRGGTQIDLIEIRGCAGVDHIEQPTVHIGLQRTQLKQIRGCGSSPKRTNRIGGAQKVVPQPTRRESSSRKTQEGVLLDVLNQIQFFIQDRLTGLIDRSLPTPTRRIQVT